MLIDVTIPNSQVAAIIAEQFPDVKFSAELTEHAELTYSETMTEYAMTLLDEGKLDKAKRFFSLLNDLYTHCEKRLASAIEKILMCKVGRRMEIDNNKWDMLAMLPETFKLLISRELIRA